MAYTGTGTQADPYIIDNWEDFLALCGTSGIYIAFDPDAENKVIDLNDTADKEGISRQISLYATVNGNGWTIRNMVYRSGYIVGNFSVISNLHFENFVSHCSEQLFSKVCFKGCSFSGFLMETNCFAAQTGTTNATLVNCSFRLRLMGKTGTLFRRYCRLTYCDIVLEGSAESLALINNSANAYLRYCRLSGSLTLGGGSLTLNANSDSMYNVHVLTVTGTGTVTASVSVQGACVIDADLISDTVTLDAAYTGWYALTTAQMQDPDYLLGLNFPVVAEA